jgi:type IV pilus assembly protein PilY1
MINTTIDVDMDYQDDAVYLGYVKRTTSSPFTWTDGGVGRLFTKESTNPTNWDWHAVVDGIGPVTSSVAKLQNNKYHNLFLYFGTGRYFYEILTNVDDPASQRKIFGVKDPCFTSSNAFDTACTDTLSVSASACTATWSGPVCNVTDVASAPTEATANNTSFKGWYVNLDLSGNYTYTEGGTPVPRAYRAERVITDPLSTSTGLIFFTTYKPYNDECGLGGKSFIWSLRYNTGGAPGSRLKGVALLQVSTGSIEQLDLSTAFNEAGGRKTSALEGVPPTQQGLSLLSTPPPIKKVIHIREK